MGIGSYMGKLRLVSEQYMLDHADWYLEIPRWDMANGGWQAGFTQPDIQVNPTSFGVVHGDLHPGNFMLPELSTFNTWNMSVLDWDSAERGWYMIDLGTMIFQANLDIYGYTYSTSGV